MHGRCNTIGFGEAHIRTSQPMSRNGSRKANSDNARKRNASHVGKMYVEGAIVQRTTKTSPSQMT